MKKRKLFVTVLVWVSLLCALPALAAQVHLAWAPSSGEVTGYRLYYGTSPGNHPNKIEVGNVTDYVVTGLKDGVTYYFVARAYNAYGESADSNELTWTSSVSDTTPPGKVINFTATPDIRQITLSWTNPADSDFAGVMIRCRTDTWPKNKTDGQLVYDGSGSPGSSETFVHTTLQDGTTYYYAAFTYDTAGNYSHTTHVSATPLPPSNQAPIITGFSVTSSSLNNPGESTTFNVQASDPDGDALSYSIDFGDGTAKGTGSQVTHTYMAKGTYTAKVTVSDGQGHSVAKNLQITVNDLPPAKVQWIK